MPVMKSASSPGNVPEIHFVLAEVVVVIKQHVAMADRRRPEDCLEISVRGRTRSFCFPVYKIASRML